MRLRRHGEAPLLEIEVDLPIGARLQISSEPEGETQTERVKAVIEVRSELRVWAEGLVQNLAVRAIDAVPHEPVATALTSSMLVPPR
jgi:hypothetical protein